MNNLRGSQWLLVEDDMLNQELVLGILEAQGVTVSVANHGAEALDQLASAEFDGVLMDCQMPVMDGYQASQKIRELPQHQSLPIIAFTGNESPAAIDKIYSSGMNAVVSKPLNPDALLDTMTQALSPAGVSSLTTATTAEPEEPAPVDEKKVPTLAPVFDPEAIARLVGDRAKSQIKFLARFLETSADDVTDLKTAWMKQDYVTTGSVAHRLKSSSGSIGAQRLSALSYAIERAAEQDKLSELPGLVAALDGHYSDAIAAIESALTDKRMNLNTGA